MRYQINDPVRILEGVGPKVAENLQRMGIETISHLLQWYPRRYIDGSQPVPVASAATGIEQAFRLTVQEVKEGFTRNRGVKTLSVRCEDESGSILVQWYNQPYLKQKLVPGSVWIMIGTVTYFRDGRTLLAPRLEQRPVIIPIYPQSGSVNSRLLHTLIKQALPETMLHDPLPEEVRLTQGLLGLKEALTALHTPTESREIEPAQDTVAFQEVWNFFMQLEQSQSHIQAEEGIVIPADTDFIHKITETLPFTLTDGQKRAIWESAQGMASGTVMTRLLNGDVGSGKTVVAGILACLVAKAKYRTAFLAPTEILAEQHYATLQQLLQRSGLKIGLWTASHQEKDVAEADLIVGTHALLYEKISLSPLGLVVVDEQHRFGVEQRTKLRENQQRIPHFLSMTATPIPRTLALTLFANLEVSQLPERPAGRLPIKTFIIDNDPYRNRMNQRMAEEIAAGRQVFVVCPAIKVKEQKEEEAGELMLFEEGSFQQGKRAVEEEIARLKKLFPTFRIETVHGKLKPAQKAEVMARMNAGEIDILVATSVVEVGVDIPNATVLVIEGAESFGLAQLHQLRGRVGRGSHQSYCFLCPHKMSQKIRERLQVIADSNDGFVIAEADLAQRGPGDVQGLSQSGLPDFRMASLTDLLFLQRVRDVVRSYLGNHPDYTWTNSFSVSAPKMKSLE